MTDIYLAGPYSARKRLRDRMQWLLARGVLVTASWVHGLHEGVEPRTCAMHDLDEIDAALGVLVDLTDETSTTGGLWVELGYAIAAGAEIMVLGTAGDANVFAHHPRVKRASGWGDTALVDWLEDLIARREDGLYFRGAA